ncbi:MAG: PAS domain-containing sensor histidine kinase [Algoriphagus sp.]|nr:PAS domain-containing sensor histidine kinase [Algoriphagus sp.]
MDPVNQFDPNQLRKKAEDILKSKISKRKVVPTESDLLRLVHELEVHQIELELQNEELILSRERSENIAQKYTSLYDFAPIGYFTLSKEGKILELNLIGAKMLGKERSFLKNRHFGQFLDGKGLLAFSLFLDKAFESKTKLVSEMTVLGTGNSPIYAQLTAIVEEEHDDNCLLTILDITDRKKAELDLEEVVRQLHILNSEKDKFFSIIAHDLKNPFNSIIGYSELLVMKVREKKFEVVEEFAGIILDSSLRAMDLLGNLMKWAQSKTGRINFNPRNIVLIEVVNEVTDMYDQIAQQKDITIRKKIPEEMVIHADEDMLATILRNLISNAVKFSKPGGEILLFSKGELNTVTLGVKDFGIGIAKDELDKLFRLDTSFSSIGTNGEKGTGLGLILCKEFVDRHGGKIWAETEKNLGSTFFVSLPR